LIIGLKFLGKAKNQDSGRKTGVPSSGFDGNEVNNQETG